MGRKPMIKPPTSSTKSSTALFAFLSPPHPHPPPPRAALRPSCLGLLLPILARAVGLFSELFTPTPYSPLPCLIEPRTEDVREGPQGRQIKSSSGGRLEPLCFMCPPHSSCRGSGNSFVWSCFFLKTRI